MAVQKVIKCFYLFLVIEVTSAFFKPDQLYSKTYEYDGDIAPRLLLTEYIKAGKIQEARERSLVTGLEPNITSYSGFFTVDEECNSNTYFWFFPSQNDWENDPVTMWLNGGPGVSGFAGVLSEHGAYNLNFDYKLELREYSWNRNSSMIYIDNPIGAGYSYADRLDCYATDQIQVGQNLLTFMQQFYLLFPELQDNPFYISGESYAGKYAPALAYAIHTSENASNIRANLKGLAIGNGWLDPINQMNFSAYLYQIGLIDSNRRNLMAREEDTCRELIKKGLYLEAFDMRTWDLISLFGSESGYVNFYNYLDNIGKAAPSVSKFVTTPEVREALHVGNATYHDVLNMTVFGYLTADFMKSVRPWLEELVEHYRVLLFSGQVDIVVAYPLTLNYLQKMEWSGSEEYKTAKRSNWYIGEQLAGYSKTVNKLTELLVRNSGHMVAMDQPLFALDLFNRFIFNQPYGQ